MNVVGTNSVNAVLEAAAKAGSDVIIQLSNGGAQFFAGKGYPDSFEAKVLGAVSCAQHVHLLAERYGVCVALHTDHANRSFWVEALVAHSERHFERTGQPLFSSHARPLGRDPRRQHLALRGDARADGAHADVARDRGSASPAVKRMASGTARRRGRQLAPLHPACRCPPGL